MVRGHRRRGLPEHRHHRELWPDYIVILAGDHIYNMDYELMLQQHVDQGADVTVGCIEVPRMEATGFGVMPVDDDDRIISFLEKPKDPPGMPDKPEMALATMGIYVFATEFLFDLLRRDAAEPVRAATSARTSSPTWSSTARRSRTASPTPASAPRARGKPTGATWARWTPTGRPTST